ncbi:MAG TPA: hypothetical protein VK453_16215 [Micromonosporaceae bacterium]|nr:hypothetical protein [Micromonosporaceae bacterium]
MSDGDGGDGGCAAAEWAPVPPETASAVVIQRLERPPVVLGAGYTGQVVLSVPPRPAAETGTVDTGTG